MESKRLKADFAANSPGSYIWEVEGKPVSIQLDLDVVDRMQLEVMRGFGLVPRRGAEVGGLLLGTAEYDERLVVRIEDFEPVACEYKSGPSYVLSEADMVRFAEAVERWKAAPERRIYAVGFYRSHTREGLGLAAEDLALINDHFSDPSNVVLLVKPFATRVGAAGFFFQEDGEIHSDSTYLEFPFRRRELQGSAAPPPADRPPRERRPPPPPERDSEPRDQAPPPPREREAPRPRERARGREREHEQKAEPVPGPAGTLFGVTATAAPALEPSAPATNNGASRLRSGYFWIPLSFIFLVLGVVLGFQAAITLHKEPPRTQPGADPYALNLNVVRSGENLELRWDSQSAAVKRGLRGQLHITEGEYTKTVDLDSNQLQVGSAIYRRVSNSVQFRLEVFTSERTSVAESMELHLNDSPAPAPEVVKKKGRKRRATTTAPAETAPAAPPQQ